MGIFIAEEFRRLKLFTICAESVRGICVLLSGGVTFRVLLERSSFFIDFHACKISCRAVCRVQEMGAGEKKKEVTAKLPSRT